MENEERTDTIRKGRPPHGRAESKPAEAGDVLVYNARGGYYTAAVNDPSHGPSQHVQVKIPPGLAFVDRAKWQQVQANGGVQARVDAGEIEVIDDWGRVKPRRCKELIGETGTIATLEQLLAKEERADVADMIESQIAKAKNLGTAGLTARRMQNNHARR